LKILVLILIILFSVYVGYLCSKSYVKRRKFLNELCGFLMFLKSEIKFKNNKIINIFENYYNESSCIFLKTFLKNYIDTFNLENKSNELFKGVDFLKNEEKEKITNFINFLGKKDLLTQVEEIDIFQQDLLVMVKKIEEDCKKYCPLYLKLGFVFGLFICLIII